ncbi:ERCC4 domain-containing protein [Azospirillum picis]|uniref:Fanconi anemia group M protein n=1 Tax=Azospirillum picis TaxID=488438 RepID=A0ABU0MM42_9PROT|nr:ERCC4 domain-containing protein [Azospirillum picis]MBP2300528.1 Fanconi anemia group M protein [Azospirillum picis]MDQ0534497.1 Fanconi anemia group M protein [Azospirillum picis]
MRIVADCHEPAEIINLLRSTGTVDGSAVEVEAKALDVGDYLIGPGAAVERKAGGDFVASLLDGRFAEQAAKLRASYDKVVWIIEGDPYDGHVRLESKVITGAISHLAMVEGATVLRTQTLQETVDLLFSMAKRLQDGRTDLSLRPAKPADPRLLAEYIVSGLPRVGRGKARALLGHFGSVRAVFAADAAEIAGIRGFGRKTAEAIRAALDAAYRESA